MTRRSSIVLACAALLAAGSCFAQEQDQLLSSAAAPSPDKDHAASLIALSTQEREAGHWGKAVEYATLASSEAEKAGLGQDQARALIELAMAQKARGDMENAIGAAQRATLVRSTTHSSLRTNALLYLASLYVSAGFPQKALEHLEEARKSTAAAQVPASAMLSVEVAAKSGVLPPAELESYCTQQLASKAVMEDAGLEYLLTAHLATAQASQGKNAEALETEERVMRMAIAMGRSQDAAICANNKAELYNRLGQREQSIEAYNQGLILVEDLPEIRLNMSINVIQAMAAAGHREAAMRTLADAKRQATLHNLQQMQPRIQLTEAVANLVLGDLQKAQASAATALATAEEQQNDDAQAQASDVLSAVYDRMQLETEARRYERLAGEIRQRIDRKAESTRADHDAQLLRLQRIEREQGDLMGREQRKETKLKQLALDAENREKQLSLLLYEKQLQEAASREAIMVSERTKQQLLLVQSSLERERQQRKIQELDNSRMMQTLNLSRMKAEQREQQRSMEMLEQQNKATVMESRAIKANQERQKAMRNLFIAAAIGALALAAWMYWAWLVARRKKRMVSEQNKIITSINGELHARNTDIESSLGYARTIQSTIIPTESTLNDLVPESFLLYKPLQSVSGDLPFVRRIGDRLYIAAIDCTGHGVPAAMMTFIAYYGLNELLLQNPTLTSGALLDRLHEHVRKVMNERTGGGLYNDGFDIGMCCMDLRKQTLCFAGAQLPLVLVRNGHATRFKGDVLPLGDDRYQRKQGYQDHHMDLRNGDALYLFSDGIIHQFGGEQGDKKFSSKRLTELLERTATMDMALVKQEAEREFEAWKSNQSQTDDVLLIGLRYAA
ncbi:MAG: SpoIIE family protein phosphatase [Bacteroidetes bacterium]|nr:SpoIIE family protein phosphatase [Bacteroidota bacterium]